MDTPPNKQTSYALEIGVAVGYGVLFCGMIVACTALSMIFLRKPVAAQTVGIANLPPLTPSPHVSAAVLDQAPKLLDENFDDDRNDWIDASAWGGTGSSREDVHDGKLFFASLQTNSGLPYVLATCKPCGSLNQPYFLAADIATDRTTDQAYGIVFHKGGNPGSFYAFMIDEETKNYYVLAADNWMLRTSGESDLIQSYPASNTLGIYVQEDRVEFYINQKIVDSYQETGNSFETGAIGFCVDGPGFTMIADNLHIYEMAGQ
ncbi:MAG TPA: hypothetical protein VLX61_07295 [Anaerolineales bacterium]|nr:hypothetical protein [Anaerolineales bacterium]